MRYGSHVTIRSCGGTMPLSAAWSPLSLVPPRITRGGCVPNTTAPPGVVPTLEIVPNDCDTRISPS